MTAKGATIVCVRIGSTAVSHATVDLEAAGVAKLYRKAAVVIVLAELEVQIVAVAVYMESRRRARNAAAAERRGTDYWNYCCK